jgi:hypothetical protein
MAGGRPKNIETPEIMWGHFEKYVEKAKSTPILVHDFVGKDGDAVRREKERPLTFEGFCNYLEDEGIISTPDHYFLNWENRYTQFIAICSRIKRVIKQDQVEGGMAGIYNPSITQRLNGLVDKKEVEHKGELKIPTIPDIGNRK